MSSVKNIVAVVGDPVNGRAALETALRLARQLECHVDALHVRSDPAATLPLVGEAMSGAMVDEMMHVAERESGTRAQKTRAMFDDVMTRAGAVSATWLETAGMEEQVVALRGCRGDFIVLSRPAADNETAALMTLNAALMQSGRAVVAAPPLAPPPGAVRPGITLNTTGPLKKIAVFWNGSTEATRAVTAALPFLKMAEQVTVLRVEEEEWFAPTEDLEAYLGRHGVKAVVSQVLPRKERTGKSLLFATGDLGADMMVMGAYTRSKLRQLMLGSVTGYVMKHALLPVLLCH